MGKRMGMEELKSRKANQENGREKVVIYALGDYWKKNSDKISGLFDVVACSDRDEKAIAYAMGRQFISPNQICGVLYDKIILGCRRRGVREVIAIQYNLPVDKIFYYDEIFEKGTVQRHKNVKDHTEHLTVVIPTYNREQRLKRTLDILEIQSDDDFDIIILDNCSEYNVEQVLNKREIGFRNRVEIVHNKANIGMAVNLANAFIQKRDEWVWMLSDDDIPSVYAVEYIYEEIERCINIGAIHFSICEWDIYIKDGAKDFKSLHELIEFYRCIIEEKPKEFNYSGDFIYFSNKVYNMKYVKPYYEKVFFYAYSGVPQLVPILFMLNEKTAEVRISNKKIVTYDTAEGDHWDWIKTMSGMRIITDFPLDLDNDDRKLLYRIIMGDNIDTLIDSVNENRMEFDVGQIEKIYEEVYQYSLDVEARYACQAKIRALRDRIIIERE